MSAVPGEAVRRVLQALADLSPEAELRRESRAIPTAEFRWLPLQAAALFRPPDEPTTQRTPLVQIDEFFGNRLASIQQVRINPIVRVGWLFVVGTVDDDGAGPMKRARVMHPLVTRAVRVALDGPRGRPILVPAGDAQISELVADMVVRDELESAIEYGGGALDHLTSPVAPADLGTQLTRLQAFAHRAAQAAGFDVTEVVDAGVDPEQLQQRPDLALVLGIGVYVADDVTTVNRASALRAWTNEDLATSTALHELYLPDDFSTEDVRTDGGEPSADVVSALELTPRQYSIVSATRGSPVTVVSGAPGTGKSHTIAAVAMDAIARGESVLVAAKSEATVDALVDLLERVPGPAPVVFGSTERRAELSERLSAGGVQITPESSVELAEEQLRACVRRCRELYDEQRRVLQRDVDLQLPLGEIDTLRRAAPAVFAGSIDLDRVRVLVDGLRVEPEGWWARRRQRKLRTELSALVGVSSDLSLDQVGRALDVVAAQRAAAAADVDVPELDSSAQWAELAGSYGEVRTVTGAWLKSISTSAERIDSRATGSIALLATALRAGRAARRTRLATLGDDRLTRALPLWVGTLADIDDLLPPRAALFDLVVLDEASSIDQGLAAPALLRGRRAMIVGDPRQLRHVSFLSDDQIARVLREHSLTVDALLAARLDARRNSIFDVAVSVAPVRPLDEHWRCDPHLIDFVARRLYDSEFSVATRTPITQGRDCVEVIRVDGVRDEGGIVHAEIDAILFALRSGLAGGLTSVGVITPFRAQADAIESAVLEAFTAAELIALDLRVGTVHQFQGNERDVVYCSLAIDAASPAASWRFAGESHLLAVMLTRARRRLIVVHSTEPPANNLLREYFAEVDSPPAPPSSAAFLEPWVSAAFDDLEGSGLHLARGYPVGRHVVAGALAIGDRPVAITVGVHRDGVDAHIDRHLSLVRSGWRVIHVPVSPWREQPARLVVELLQLLRRPDASGIPLAPGASP